MGIAPSSPAVSDLTNERAVFRLRLFLLIQWERTTHTDFTNVLTPTNFAKFLTLENEFVQIELSSYCRDDIGTTPTQLCLQRDTDQGSSDIFYSIFSEIEPKNLKNIFPVSIIKILLFIK